MMTNLLPVRAGLLSALLLAGAASAAPNSKARTVETDRLRLNYAISLLGLPIGTVSVSGSVGPSQYRLDASGKLTGLAGVIVNTKGAATASGGLAGGRLAPASFAATAATSNYLLTIRMAMSKGNAKQIEITPPYLTRPDRVPLTDADRRGISDPLSAFVMPVPGIGDVVGPEACNRSLPLFDGGVRFDVVLTYTATRQVQVAGYSGPVAVCAARYKPIAGHRPNRPATKFMAENKEIEIWLAPVGGTRYVVPFRVSVLTMIGTAVVEATDLEITTETKAASVPH